MTSPPTVDEGSSAQNLTGQITHEEHYFAYGAYSEVYEGNWTEPSTGKVTRVAIKALRGVHNDPAFRDKTIQRLNRETRVWVSLEHPNIIPFFGLCEGITMAPAMVSPYYARGNITKYTTDNPNTDRLAFILGVARGLEYLHSRDVLHGDLKGHNVLVDDDGCPRLADFGRSKFIDRRGFTTAFTGSARYMAPELTNDAEDIDINTENTSEDVPDPLLTKQTDVYAFSMVMIEILTGHVPFFYLRQDHLVIILVQEGKRPDRGRCEPTVFTDPEWELMADCWAHDPSVRPTMHTVIRRLEMCRLLEHSGIPPEPVLPTSPIEPVRLESRDFCFVYSKQDYSHLDDLTERVSKGDSYHFAVGGCGDVWKGKMFKGRMDVAVKVVRSAKRSQWQSLNMKLLEEANIWNNLDHPNIIPFYGICFNFHVPSAPSLVCPLYRNGHIGIYLERNPHADRMAMVCQVASGLNYLHNNSIIHGDIKSSNILVADDHRACICDFGFSRVSGTTRITPEASGDTEGGGTWRWMAPEIEDILLAIKGKNISPVIERAPDTWAFSMTVLEIFSDKLPFYWIKSNETVFARVLCGVRPTKEHYFEINNTIWLILKECWLDPDHRPSMESLSTSFESLRADRPTAQECPVLPLPWGPDPKFASLPLYSFACDVDRNCNQLFTKGPLPAHCRSPDSSPSSLMHAQR